MTGSYKVYMYTFPDGKVYIGVTSRKLTERRDFGYRHNHGLTAALRMHGWHGIKKEILIDGLSKESAFEMEQKLIAEYDATNPLKGYNISHGGIGTFRGLKHSEEHKRYMSELYKGRHFSSQALQNMKNAHSKERHTVASLDESKRIVKRYQSLGEAADDIGGYKSNISRVCGSPNKKYKGFYWMKITEGGGLG